MMPASNQTSAYDIAALERQGRTIGLGRIIHYHDTIDSTNAAALALAQQGAPHGTMVLADAQLAGRGRRGRTWYSPPGHHIYCSLILHLDAGLRSFLTFVPLASALATAEAIEEVSGVACRLKWPNDVLIGEKKVAGILCENVGKPADPVIIVGIGINVNGRPQEFPIELRKTAGTLMDETGSSIDRSLLVAALLNRLATWLRQWSLQGRSPLLTAYRRRCATVGRPVRAILDRADPIEGIAEAIGADGSLQVRRRKPGSSRSDLIEVHSADIIHLERVTGIESME